MRYFKYCLIVFVILIDGFISKVKSQASLQVLTEKDLVDYVNPYIGNIDRMLTPTYPTVHLPNSFMRISPSRVDYTDVTLQGLSLLRAGKDFAAFNLSPIQGDETEITPVISYSYDNEEVTPYSYSVILDKHETEVNLGVSHQSAIYQVSFKEEKDAFLILNAERGEMRWDGKELSGYQLLENGVRVYVYLLPDKAPINTYVLENEELIDRSQAEGKNASMVLKYSKDTPEINLRYGISFISVEQARKNMEREVLSTNIDELQSKGRKIWNDALNKIKADGSENDKTVFYTALYRSYYRPVSMSEDGHYFSAFDGKVHEDKGIPFYTDDSAWGTYRALHPLNALLDAEKEEALLTSYLRAAEQLDQFRMPKTMNVTGNQPGMHSNDILISFLDAYNKGIRGFDLEKAFRVGKNVVTKRTLAPGSDEPAGRLNKFYQEHGYVPAIWETDKELTPQVKPEIRRMAVSVTLGTAYDDWALAQMAKELDLQEDFQYFCNRSFNYRNLFNSRTKFFHPKDTEGKFLSSFDYELSGGQDGKLFFTEGNAWNYRFGLQYNLQDHINMMGGRSAFAEKLDSLFSKSLGLPKYRHYLQYPTQTGIVGGFAMGNEPSFHIPYLYNYAGKPWKTQERIRILLRQWFRNDLMGMPGDEAAGSMSAFAVFSFVGLYPVTPGMPVYNIGSPVFEQVNIELPNNLNFEIIAKNNSEENKYIQSAILSGQPLNKPWLNHSDIINGGKLILEMGPRPNKEWGVSASSAPPSMPIKCK
ncbi:GH92 family glycosyl hydrolase [Autumnicola musiva]|uniref:GH92 family glycosyl hydrolase n=1 Tax=Autumnicola musiva TaxID=3075589 RepID=A0ABU3D9X8_9FLAO|nr:GH92 family glycosyl hydrolase [Zunongwangia sp. F117]MDT0678343.1 GH92 family glycosyl hydrolase [Zunongwangia sp. F117]